MNEIITQIYEIQEPDDAEKMIALGVDHVGSVVLSEEKWRDTRLRETLSVVDRSPAKSSLILLFNRAEVVYKALDYYRPDIVHFCEALVMGSELSDNFERLIQLQGEVKHRFPEIKIMRSIPIPTSGVPVSIPVLEIAARFQPISDYFLTDTLILTGKKVEEDQQPVSGFIGITGQTCDWELAANLVQFADIPVILAGGISPDNVFEGIQRTLPAGIDSCTCTNARDREGHSIRFKKDIEKVRQMVAEVKRAKSRLAKNN